MLQSRRIPLLETGLSELQGKGRQTMKDLLLQGILGDQEGQDTLEWVAIAALIVLIAVAVMAIIRTKVISEASAIDW
jgi:hypothetical protein